MNSIKVKILGLTALIMLLTGALVLWTNLRTQQTVLDRFSEQNGRVLGETIRNSIIAAMANGQNDEVGRILQRIGREPAINSVQIMNPSGQIIISAQANEAGAMVSPADLSAFQAERLAYTENSNGREQHITMVPIQNEPRCHRCHDPGAKLLGVLNVHRSLNEMALIQKKGSQILFFSILAMLGVMVVALSAFVLNYVEIPLRKIAQAMNLLEQGNFEQARTGPANSREIALLSNQFNRMRERIKELLDRTVAQEREMAIADEKLAHQDEIREMNSTLEERLKEIGYLNATLEKRIEEIEEANFKIADLAGELEDRNTTLDEAVKRLQMLHQLGLDLNATMDSERLFTLLTQRIMEVLQARIGYILLLDRDSWSLTIGAAAGIPGTVDKQLRIPLKPGGVSHWVIKNRQPLLIGNINSSSDFNRNSYLGYTRETVICTPLTSGDEIVGTMTIANHKDGNAFTSEDLELTSTIAAQASIAIKNALLYKDLQSTYLNTVQALISAVEANDTYTHGHSDRVRHYALRLAEYMGLPNETIKNLEQAAILHDIGKIGICESLLNKKEPLCREEIETLRQHPVIGARILQPIRFLEPIREIIHQHHERHDGYGYPKGLQGEQTLLEARILAIADTYDAMTSDRPYRAALSHEATIAEIWQHAGSQFDPVIAAAFLRMVEQDQLAG